MSLEHRATGVRAPEKGQDLAATLERIDARLARLEQALAPVVELGSQGSAVVATAVDVFDDHAARLGDIEARVQSSVDVLERLTRPQTMASLRQLVDIAESAPKLVAVLADVLDETMAEAAEEGLELHRIVGDAKRLAMNLLRLTTSPELEALTTSGMLDPRALRLLGMVARATAEADADEPPRVSMLGMVRALGDADVQRSMGFALRIMSGLGRSLTREKKILPRP